MHLLKHPILEFLHIGVTLGRRDSLFYNTRVFEWVFWPFIAPYRSQPSSLTPAAQESETPLVKGYLGIGKPGWGEEYRAVRGSGEAIWEEGHSNLAVGQYSGKEVEKAT